MLSKPMDIAKVIVMGLFVMWVLNYLMGFYGFQGKSAWPYMAFFLFILFSTAILDLQVPTID